MEANTIGAVGLVRQIRDELYEKTRDMTADELIAFYRGHAAATKAKLSRSLAVRARGARTGPCITLADGAGGWRRRSSADRWADDTHHLMSRPGC